MSHEKSVTLNIEDFWFNAPSIHKGKSYTEDQVRDMILNKLKSESDTKINLSRYKGLGEMNAHQLWETTMDPEKRTLLQVTMEDAEEANEIFKKTITSYFRFN